ncbi:MAG TPA: SLC13 family permease [Nitrososphaerales archaeon]|nr:SLC13 family permease [Nitrososphaerales archaeon]
MSPAPLQQFDPMAYLTLAFLFGIAGQFGAMDGDSFLKRVVSGFEARVGVLYSVVIVAGLFSPVILNDVVIVILTPVIIRYSREFGVDPAPLLVAEITTVNIASSLTPIGNPQNILLWSESMATFGEFVAGTWVAVLASMAIASLALLPLATKVGRTKVGPAKLTSIRPGIYLAAVAATAVLLDLAGMPPWVSLGAGFLLGFPFTFRSLGRLAAGFDLRSLLTLYVFIGGVTLLSVVISPVISQSVQPVASGAQPYSALFVGSVSNVISNVPATQLILNTVRVSAQVAPKIAVEAGLAGNIGPIGSFANLLALQMARRAGLPIRRTILLQLAIGVVSFAPAFL